MAAYSWPSGAATCQAQRQTWQKPQPPLLSDGSLRRPGHLSQAQYPAWTVRWPRVDRTSDLPELPPFGSPARHDRGANEESEGYAETVHNPPAMDSAVVWAWAPTRRRIRGFLWGTIVLSAATAVATAVVVAPGQATWVVRAAIGLLGFGLAVLAIGVLLFACALVLAPYQQRNDLQQSLEATTKELRNWLPEGTEGDIQKLLAQHFQNVPLIRLEWEGLRMFLFRVGSDVTARPPLRITPATLDDQGQPKTFQLSLEPVGAYTIHSDGTILTLRDTIVKTLEEVLIPTVRSWPRSVWGHGN